MHLHRGFGDADIVGNLFAQAGRAPLEWELVEVDDALRPPAGASKVHVSQPSCKYGVDYDGDGPCRSPPQRAGCAGLRPPTC